MGGCLFPGDLVLGLTDSHYPLYMCHGMWTSCSLQCPSVFQRVCNPLPTAHCPSSVPHSSSRHAPLHRTFSLRTLVCPTTSQWFQASHFPSELGRLHPGSQRPSAPGRAAPHLPPPARPLSVAMTTASREGASQSQPILGGPEVPIYLATCSVRSDWLDRSGKARGVAWLGVAARGGRGAGAGAGGAGAAAGSGAGGAAAACTATACTATACTAAACTAAT